MAIARIDQSIIGRWWWTVDRWTVVAIIILCGFGSIMIFAASPAVATRIGASSFYFVKHQLLLLPLTMLVIFGISLQSPRMVRRTAAITLLLSLVLLAATFVVGTEIKGARRWVSLAGISIQPSEFVKPAFAVICAWLFAEQKNPNRRLPGNAIAIGLYLLIAAMLLKQPDLGQTVVISTIWFVEFFLAGLPIILVGLVMMAGAGGLVGAYFLFPHVHSRIDRFLNPQNGDSYQVTRSLEAFANGGLWGTGPGEGTVKNYLPDAHADFVFAVAGEEFGLVVCLAVVVVFAFVVLRGLSRLLSEQNLYVVLAGTGLLVQFGLQAVINMASTLHMIPTKGMTLPFLSYGGSSLLALGVGTGMLLALTRKRYGASEGL
ncbi:MAG TPA: putative lipid II flippase FtsW [Stellaceae bacterium]|nr:putative lipid II flippase FtsW [Stellaceae bacterium]